MRRWARFGAVLSAFLLLVSGLSTSALTAGIQISSTAIGPPEHTFGDDGRPGASARQTPIPRAAFERVRGLPARGPAAFGGDRVYDIDVDGKSYRVHEFTTVGTATLTVARALDVEVLIVAGGGGGGGSIGGGGGAGEFVERVGAANRVSLTPSGSPFTVTVGAGGTGGSYTGPTDGDDGDDSSAFGITANGGGGGGAISKPGRAGGSGGGGGSATSNVGGAAVRSGMVEGVLVGFGNAGGIGSCSSCGSADAVAGGGGGAGGVGSPYSGQQGGDGGPGRSSSITGVAREFAGGGGGGINTDSRAGANALSSGPSGAGQSGGGAGGDHGTRATDRGVTDGYGQDAVPNSGSGGGGAGNPIGEGGQTGGAGGSGIVIVRYEIPRSTWGPVASGGTVTEFVGDGTDGTVDGFRYRVHTFVEDDTLVVPAGSTLDEVDVLLVGGGGGGGARHGGGGGGGGVLESSGRAVTVGSHAVSVGQGGVGMTASTNGADGEDSEFLTLVAEGGGRGAGVRHGPGSGGSGGGSSSASGAGTGAAGQGSSGAVGVSGSGGDNEGGWAGGGGGGAGGAGSPGSGGGAARDATGGTGGNGRASTISGSEIVYGGGGGGAVSHRSSGVAGAGGGGGGGAGGSFGWELYDASGVGRALSWRFFHHSRGHPTNAADFDAFFAGSPDSSGSASFVAADQSASGTTLGTVNALNWTSAANLASVIGALSRTNNFAFEVTGWFVPRETGTYWFTLESDDAADLRIGGTTVASYFGGRGTPSLGTTTGSIGLVAGQAYALRARMEEVTGGEGLRVFWQTPTQRGASTTTWWQNADELIGTSPSGSPVSGPELARFIAASSRFATPRGLASVASQEAGGSATPNTLNWLKSPDNSTNDLSQADVIGVSGLSLDFMLTVAGTFVPTETGTYTFALSGDDAVDLTVDGTTIVDHYGQHAAPSLGSRTGTASLTAGVPVRVAVRHHQRDGGAALQVFWRNPLQSTGWHQDDLELRASGRDGVDGLGGGGGAGGFSGDSSASGGRGGDGVVVIRYPLFREVDAIPSEVREAIAGEGETTAVLRWRVPDTDAPSVDLDGYRIEYAATNDNSWTALASGVTFSTSGAGSETLVTAALTTAALTVEPDASRHRFRITPLGTVDGPSTIVEPVAKGGNIVTLVGDDVVHQYTTVGTRNFDLVEQRTVRHLLVGGGGAGGSVSLGSSGGGGGGRVIDATLAVTAPTTIAVTVGGGGAPTAAGSIGTVPSGGDGASSSIVLGGTTVSALGGGGGANSRLYNVTQGTGSTSGWTGGGGSVHAGTWSLGSTGVGGAGVRGGDAHANSSSVDPQAAGGGGGAGGVGTDAVSGSAGAGGSGALSDITGTSLRYGGGGGGGKRTNSGSAGAGGAGGGGAGGKAGVGGSSGASGTGGGGGGAGEGANQSGGAGGSGIVVVRYPFLDSGVQGGVFAATATSAVLRWEDPAVGAETITGYRIERLGPPSAEWGGATVATPTPNSTVQTLELSGLTSNAQRRFRVTALHGDRDGSTTELTVIGRGGDTVTLVGDDVVHQYTTVGTRDFELAADRTVEYLIVGGGGGGGGGRGGGGGGGGGLITGSAVRAAASSSVMVGSGGVGGSHGSSGTTGQPSSVFALTSAGGGGGGQNPSQGSDGGSGGGSRVNSSVRGGAATQPASSTGGFGNDGGGYSTTSTSGSLHYSGGGGGGAGGSGHSGTATAGPNRGRGGEGRTSLITGISTIYAGGGGGGRGNLDSDGRAPGGSGGGGSGGDSDDGWSAANATGGGGGGGGYRGWSDPPYSGGRGGSGIVVLRYAFAS